MQPLFLFCMLRFLLCFLRHRSRMFRGGRCFFLRSHFRRFRLWGRPFLPTEAEHGTEQVALYGDAEAAALELR